MDNGQTRKKTGFGLKLTAILLGVVDALLIVVLVLCFLMKPDQGEAMEAQLPGDFAENADTYWEFDEDMEVPSQATVNFEAELPEPPAETVDPAAGDSSLYEGFIFPDSNTVELTDEMISEKITDQATCQRAINEIYARHGRTFRSRELTDYFATKTWYYGSIAPADFNSAVFNTYENTNIKFLTDAENALTGGAGYVLDQPGYDIYAVGISDYYYDDDRLENDFIFYDSDTRYLTDEEVKGLSLQVVCYAKNEIYARRGRIFDSQELNDYFYSKPWYYGRILPEDFSSDVFNKYELANITLLDGYERALDPNGYQLY